MAMKSQTQKSLLFAFIASISLCGLVGIYCLLVGQLGEFEARILLSTAAIGAASILALAAAIPWERKRWQPLGPVGIVVVAATLVQTLCAIWIDRYVDSEGAMKTLGISTTFAVALPHLGLLSLARLRRGYEWVRIATIISIAILACLICFMILAEANDEGLFRLLGTFSILDVCGTITIPILHRVSAVTTRESIRSAALEISMTCPRCEKTAVRPVGRSHCPHCGLVVDIEIEEEHCPKCGYVLFGTVSSQCPECGAAISKSSETGQDAAQATSANDA